MKTYLQIITLCFLATIASAQEKILFLGDSNTYRGHYIRFIDQQFKKTNAKNAPILIKSGVSGETASNLSEIDHPGRRKYIIDRLDAELTKHNPDWVVACYGINCGIYHPFSKEHFTAYQNGIKELIAKVQQSGAKLILVTPPPYAKKGPGLTGNKTKDKALIQKANQEAKANIKNNPALYGYKNVFPYYDEIMSTYSAWIMKQAHPQKRIWTLDIRTPLWAAAKQSYGRDPIHYNKHGHQVIADTFVKNWEAIQKIK